VLGTAAAVAAGTAGVLVTLGGKKTAAGGGCAPPARPALLQGDRLLVGDVNGDTCPETLIDRAGIVTVPAGVFGTAAVRFRIGYPGDQIAVGDWDCDGVESAGLYRPGSGEVLYFDRWPAEGAELEPALVAVLPTGGQVRVAPRHPDACATLAIR
jgi:hypothetical protein